MESLIKSKIIISETVVFIPASRELKNALTGDSVTLHTPANYCLLYLLANRPQIMSKSELIKVSWNDEIQIISDNTFYQMVFNLRQNLVKVGGEAVIVTVPRRGLKINPDVTVEIIDASGHERTGASNNSFSSLPIMTDGFSLRHGSNVFLVMLSGALFVLSGFIYTSEADDPAFYDYRHQEYKMCTVAYNEQIGKDNVSSLVIKSGIDCSHKRHIILTQSDNHSRLSAISCPAGTLTTKNCSLSLSVQ